MKKQINVVGAVIVRDGKILAAQRGEGTTLAGMWEFPGGKIESGETPKEALQRELVEELLCEAEIGDHVETVAHEYDFGIVNLACYYATLIKGEPQLTEHAEIRWIAPADLSSVEWAPADIPAVKQIMLDYAS